MGVVRAVCGGVVAWRGAVTFAWTDVAFAWTAWGSEWSGLVALSLFSFSFSPLSESLIEAGRHPYCGCCGVLFAVTLVAARPKLSSFWLRRLLRLLLWLLWLYALLLSW